MTYPTPIPAPTPACAAFETLLPLLDTDTLTPDEATATREHIAGCAWCHAQRTGYNIFEAALRRHYSSDVSDGSSITLEGIARADGMVNEDEVAMDDESQLVLEVSPIAQPIRRAPRRRWRLAEIAAVLVVGLLAAALLVNRIGPSSGNQPPLKSPVGAVVFTHSVPWGKLQINGRTVEVTTDGRDPLYLPRGRNTLTYLAPPLPALTCTISAPPAQGDTCPLHVPEGTSGWIDSSSGTNQPILTYGGRVVDLEAIPDHLSGSQREALLTAIQRQFQALNATMTIQPGDHYATPEGRFLTSDRAFAITLRYTVTADTIGPDLMNCAPYCDVPDNRWSVTPTISWDYIDQYGKPETVLQGPGGLGGAASELNVQWDGSWHVTLTDGTGSSSLCEIVDDIILSRADNTGVGVGCYGMPINTYGGQLMQLSGADPKKIGYALYRGGALIALDNTARTFAPWMPRASTHELAIARQLGFTG
ncbi:MAG TPA: hypothetical protein VFS83_18955 [Ktedonobacterales bacterium]|nr:hypothetical protein [Ktedonobacterales bacterium]